VRHSRTTVSGPARPDASDAASAFSFAFTRASLFGEVGKQTPVFVRFSSVLGERGSTDTARDVRGFAVTFYTDDGNASGIDALRSDGRTLEFIKDQYRHCKPIPALGDAVRLLKACNIDAVADTHTDAGLIVATDPRAAGDAFITAMAQHRHFARETDPPRI
jgi:hypothetical protein